MYVYVSIQLYVYVSVCSEVVSLLYEKYTVKFTYINPHNTGVNIDVYVLICMRVYVCMFK